MKYFFNKGGSAQSIARSLIFRAPLALPLTTNFSERRSRSRSQFFVRAPLALALFEEKSAALPSAPQNYILKGMLLPSSFHPKLRSKKGVFFQHFKMSLERSEPRRLLASGASKFFGVSGLSDYKIGVKIWRFWRAALLVCAPIFFERRSRSRSQFSSRVALPLALSILRAPLGAALLKSGALQYSA